MVCPKARRGAVNSAEVIGGWRLLSDSDALAAFQQNPRAAAEGGKLTVRTRQNRHPICCKIRRIAGIPGRPGHMNRNYRSRRVHSSNGFTLVEIMIVVGIIALLAMIAVPSFLRARKRSQATSVKNDLRMIDSAISQYAIETNRTTGDTVQVDDWQDYVDGKLGDTTQDIFGNDYGDQLVDTLPPVPASTWDALTDVADSAFWSPYTREGPTPSPRHRTRRRHHP
jgi:prepilin-type N-terminal cleavage/methylation domain-containing protein